MRSLAKVLTVLLLSPAAAMAEPVALVLEVSGEVTPPVAVFEEVADGTVLHLGKDATLTISHYGTCRELSLAGGEVTAGEAGLEVEGGTVLSRKDQPCVGRVVTSEADLINMAVTLRSVWPPQTMAARPEFILAGIWGEQFDRLDVFGDKGHVTTLPVFGGHVAWPASQAPLKFGVTYAVVLNGPDVQQQAARIKVAEDARGMTVLNRQ